MHQHYVVYEISPILMVQTVFFYSRPNKHELCFPPTNFSFSMNYSVSIRKCEIFWKQNIFLIFCSIYVPNLGNVAETIIFFVEQSVLLTPRINELLTYSFCIPLFVNPLFFAICQSVNVSLVRKFADYRLTDINSGMRIRSCCCNIGLCAQE